MSNTRIYMNIQNALKIDGWMSEAELEFLATIAKKSDLIVEFGCYKGRSTRALADNTHGKVIAVDPWNGLYKLEDDSNFNIDFNKIYAEFKENLKDKIDNGIVYPFKMRSTDFLMNASPDFVFIDGDHRYPAVKKDIEIALELMKRGGVLAGHDYTHDDWPGVKKAVDEMFPKINQVDSIWWVKV